LGNWSFAGFRKCILFGISIAERKEQLRQRDKQIEESAARVKELEEEIRELKELLVDKAKSKEPKPPREASNFSVSRHPTLDRASLESCRHCGSRGARLS
jgi:hypothetical protein